MATAKHSKVFRTIFLLIALLGLNPLICQAQNVRPVADAGSSRYAGSDLIVLDGTDSYDPDNSGILSYSWGQISGPILTINDADTATPTISGFVQTDEIKECQFELLVSDGELTSMPDTVKVIIVPDFGTDTLRLENPPFDPDKPTFIFFGGGDCTTGTGNWSFIDWPEKANVISFTSYGPDSGGGVRNYYKYGDMIIVYLSSVASDYKQPIQTSGWSTGGQPAIDVGTRLNLTYADARYAVNRVTFLDATSYCRNNYRESITTFLGSSVDGEQCWIDTYASTTGGGGFGNYPPFHKNVLNVWFSTATGNWNQRHSLAPNWYRLCLRKSDRNDFNHGVVAGAYWSVVGPGKNLQLASTPVEQTYKFSWYGDASSGHMDFYDEPNHPGRLPEPVTLVGPEDGFYVDADGAVFSCEVSENAIGYQLLFGPDPYRVMDYYIASDTPEPPSEVITSSPFDPTWWTIRVYDQYGSTIYADPVCVNFEKLDPPPIENINTGQGYGSIRHAIYEAQIEDEIVVRPGVYRESINFKGKNLTLRSIDPGDSTVVSETIITSDGDVVSFSGGEDANCAIAGFTITGGKRGIYCSNASPTITYCIIEGNAGTDTGAGMYVEDLSNPTLVNCTFVRNSSSIMGGGIQSMNSSPTLINCTFHGNSATYFGGGIYFAGGNPTVTNCILWDDTPDEIYIITGTPTITYSDVQGGFVGEGNIDADPLFADVAGCDYHLKSQAGRWDPVSESWAIDDLTSPCIDAGDPGSDWAGEVWPHGERINMGAYGGTPQASISTQPQAMSLPAVAYIHLRDAEATESFRSLLMGYACPVTMISLNDVTSVPLDSYDLIIVGNDTGSLSNWNNNELADAIEASGKPVLGLGEGGYAFFGKLELSIGWPNGMHGEGDSLYAVDPNSLLFDTPYRIDIPEDEIIQLYTESGLVLLHLWPPPETVKVLGRAVGHTGYYTLVIEHDRYVFWGFTESPLKMTEDGKRLFINTVIRTANMVLGK